MAIVFVDAPSFDDTNKTDLEILELHADWLNMMWVPSFAQDPRSG